MFIKNLKLAQNIFKRNGNKLYFRYGILKEMAKISSKKQIVKGKPRKVKMIDIFNRHLKYKASWKRKIVYLNRKIISIHISVGVAASLQLLR